MNKTLLILITIVILLGAAVFGWYYFSHQTTSTDTDTTQDDGSGFVPFGRTPSGGGRQGTLPTGGTTTPSQDNNPAPTTGKVPVLRLISSTPVGGYSASTTASTTVIRWVDRGRGNVYETKGDSLAVTTLSNTLVPKIYESLWNKNMTAFVALALQEYDSGPNGIYAELRLRQTVVATTSKATKTASSTAKTATSTIANIPANPSEGTLYQLRGNNLPNNIIGFAVSPKKDKVLLFVNESGTGVGYTSSFDGKGLLKVFSTPVTQAVVEWPEENTFTLLTKGAAAESGYFYFINAKTGTFKKLLGPYLGLTAKASRDAKRIVFTVSNSEGNFATGIYDVTKQKITDAGVKTLADKCVWSTAFLNEIYCAVPSRINAATYPDDWYLGNVSFVDKIWNIDALTGQTRVVSSIIDSSDRVIDAYNLTLDPKDNYLLFTNKDDLTLWSLDLVRTH